MTNPIAAYEAATTREEAKAAFDALVEQIMWEFDQDDDYTDEDCEGMDFVSAAEKALNDRGIEITHTSEWA